MKYDIKRGNNLVISVRAEGKESIQMMGAEIVNMSFVLPEKVSFQINDTVVVYGRTYFLKTEPGVEKRSSREYAYNLSFVGIKYKLAEVQFFMYDQANELTVPEFSPITTAETLVDLLISNANRIQSSWVKGVVDVTDPKQVDFSGENCLSALNKIAEAFDLEFWVDGNKSIHFTERNQKSGNTFKYGKGNGLKGITRTPIDETGIVTRLYAVGSDKNLPANYRNGQKKLRMPVAYLEKNVSIYGRIEKLESFDEIYPKRVGTVTSVDATNPLIFSDSAMDFDLNATDPNGNTTILIKGAPAWVIFQTGQLAGYSFDIKEFGFISASKTFTLLTNKDEITAEIPNNLMKPQVGDTYILENIMMPSNYVHDAEAELQDKAQEYIDEFSHQKIQYTVISDPIDFKKKNIDVSVGFSNHMIDTEFGLDDDLRVTATVKDLQDKYDVQFEMAETSGLAGIISTAINNQNQMNSIIKGTKFNKELARLSYFFAREMFDKVFDGEGFFDPEIIKPLSINTKAISLGSPMQAFAMPNVSFFVESNLTSVSYTSGELSHYGLVDNSIRSWFLTGNIINALSSKFNYIYIKCEKNGTVGTVVISENAILVDSDPNFYFFEAGVLSSVNTGYRQIKMTHGFGMINPAEISIGRISSPFGGSYIEILQDKIKIHADVEFADDSIAFEQINGQIFIGGENLLQQSGEPLEYYDFIESKDRYYNQELPFTLSVDALNTQAVDAVFVIVGKNANTNQYEVIAERDIALKGITERIAISFKCFLNNYKKISSQLVKKSDSAVINTIKPKLETGNRPTDYNQSQYDVNLKIEEIEKKTNFLTTSIYGNIVATGTVLLGNYETGTNAGITGEGSIDEVFLWGGSTFSNRDTAPIRFYRNGKGVLKNVQVEGDIIAETGRLGGVDGWYIDDKKLINKGQGNIVFGDVTPNGILNKGLMIGYDVIPSESYNCNLWINNTQLSQNVFNVGAIISASGGLVNIGATLSAEGGQRNSALIIEKGDFLLDNGSGDMKVYYESDIKVGFTGFKNIGGVNLLFVKGLFIG